MDYKKKEPEKEVATGGKPVKPKGKVKVKIVLERFRLSGRLFKFP